MFRHHGSTRTFRHNLKIATLLSFVAGSVNVVGFLSVHTLTTNVTGHFAFFVGDVYNFRMVDSIMVFLYIFTFFIGAFVSNLLVENTRKFSERHIFVMPVAIEIIILLAVGLFGHHFYISYPGIISFSLLFAMGLQNSLVTQISNAVVRTTHLTGLFTDIGIEISQLFFYKTPEQQKKLRSNIYLRLRIIVFFFIGGITAGLVYSQVQLYTMLIPGILLSIGLMYDNIKFKILRWKKKNAR